MHGFVFHRFTLSGFVRSVIVLATLTALLLAPPASYVGHDPFKALAAEAERHAALEFSSEPDAQVARDHVHDDGEPHERVPGHAHGHDRGDHLHDLGKSLSATTYARRVSVLNRLPKSETEAPPRVVFRLDRPPKTSVI
jgi:hypothetical protein